MKIKTVPFDNGHYVSNVSQTDTILRWDSMGITHSLIVRGEFGTEITFTESMRRSLETADGSRLLEEQEIYLDGGLYCVLVPKVFMNNYSITVKPASYAVFGCSLDKQSGELTVYVTTRECNYLCSVAMRIDVSIKPEPEKRGFLGFGRRQDRKYFLVRIPQMPGYEDGSLFYTYDGCRYMYPITRAMLGSEIPIPAFGEKAPLIKSKKTNGYTITTR